MPNQGDTSNQDTVRSRFVVVCPPDEHGRTVPPEPLSRVLATRNANVVVRAGVYAAMCDLMEHERDVASGHPREPMVVLVVEPDRVPMATELVGAVLRYVPHAVCWRFDADREPQLRAFDEGPRAREVIGAQGPGVTVRRDVGPIRPRPTQSPAPRLRLTADEPIDAPLEPRPDEEEDAEPERPALSEEELDMLLSDDWEDQTGRTRPT